MVRLFNQCLQEWVVWNGCVRQMCLRFLSGYGIANILERQQTLSG